MRAHGTQHPAAPAPPPHVGGASRRTSGRRRTTVPVVVVSDGPVLLAGLRAALGAEGLPVAAGLSSFAALRPGPDRELLLAAPAGDIGTGLLAALRGGRPAVVLLREATLRVHGDELERTTGCSCLPLTVGSAEVASALERQCSPAGPVLGRTAVVTGPGGRMTPREQEVLVELARGLANREIAEALGVTDETVKAHLKRVYRKLGVASRAEAISAYLVGMG